MNYKELINALRSTKSRSKRALLDEAADTIEALVADLREMDRHEVCDLCTHGQGHPPCEWVGDFDCETCPLDCACHDCRDCSAFEWRGRLQED